MRLLKIRLCLLIAISGIVCVGCWGDPGPSLDEVGAVRSDSGEIVILFGSCPGERVQRVEVKRTDSNFESADKVLWSVEASVGGAMMNSFVPGERPPGFREMTPLAEPLVAGDHVLIVVTSSDRGTIPMSLSIARLRKNEVLTQGGRSQSSDEFKEGVARACQRRGR